MGISWRAVAICALSYFLRMFGLIAGYHRYFSHRSYSTSRPMQFLLALLGTISGQRGLFWWVAAHRHHHIHSDTEEDVHSPVLRSVLYAHSGWFLDPKQRETKLALIPDLAKFPELVWLNRWAAIPMALYGLALYLAFGVEGFVWGFLVSTVLVWHAIHALSSFAHTPGGFRRYPTSDYSRNKWFLAFITLGEGWHNNHHYYPVSVRHGFVWWEIDIAYYVLRVMSWIGLVWDLKLPPRHVVEGHLPGLERRLERFRSELSAIENSLRDTVESMTQPGDQAETAGFHGWLEDFFQRARDETWDLFLRVPDRRLHVLHAWQAEVLDATEILSPAWRPGEIQRLRKTLAHDLDALSECLPFAEALRAQAGGRRSATEVPPLPLEA